MIKIILKYLGIIKEVKKDDGALLDGFFYKPDDIFYECALKVSAARRVHNNNGRQKNDDSD